MEDKKNILEEQSTKECVESESTVIKELSIYIDCKLDTISQEIDMNNSKQMEKINESIGKLTGGLNQLLSGMKSELEAVKNIAIEKEAKIQRYEEGYDQKNIKGFFKDLLRIIDFTNDKKENNSDINEIYEDLELLLENVGVEKINLAVGDNYDGNAKTVKVINTKDTDDTKKDNTVCQVKKEGYYIAITEEQIKIIRPTEVVLYKYQENKSFNFFAKGDK